MWFKRTNSSFTQDWTHSSQEKVWEEKIVWMSSSFGWKLTQNWLDIDCYTYREGEGRGGKGREGKYFRPFPWALKFESLNDIYIYFSIIL